jgi:ferredoxin-NADP reductase
MSMPRKIRCQVEAVIDHGDRVYSLDLTPASPVPPFRPGQFLHLTVEDYDPAGFWPESRVFSIASSPRNRQHLRLCYSVKGRYTTRMEQVLAPGREVWVKLPYGDFVIDDAREAVLVAGGTGISAFTAFLEALTAQTHQNVTLVYGARTPALFLFREMLLAQLAAVANFRGMFFTETADALFAQQLAAHPQKPACLTGRISVEDILRGLYPHLRPLSALFYLSGPPGMRAVLGAGLRAAGVPPEQVRTDAWE